MLLICYTEKSQTRREAGSESHGSLRDSRVAWNEAVRLFSFKSLKQPNGELCGNLNGVKTRLGR